MDTAKVTNEMDTESASMLGSSSRAGRRGWGNLQKEKATVRMGPSSATGNRADRK